MTSHSTGRALEPASVMHRAYGLETVKASCSQDDPYLVSGQGQSRGLADTAGGAGDDGDLLAKC